MLIDQNNGAGDLWNFSSKKRQIFEKHQVIKSKQQEKN